MSETSPSYTPPTRQQLISRLHELADGMLETACTMRSFGNGDSEDQRLILRHADDLLGARRMLNTWIAGLQEGEE